MFIYKSLLWVRGWGSSLLTLFHWFDKLASGKGSHMDTVFQLLHGHGRMCFGPRRFPFQSNKEPSRPVTDRFLWEYLILTWPWYVLLSSDEASDRMTHGQYHCSIWSRGKVMRAFAYLHRPTAGFESRGRSLVMEDWNSPPTVTELILLCLFCVWLTWCSIHFCVSCLSRQHQRLKTMEWVDILGLLLLLADTGKSPAIL